MHNASVKMHIVCVVVDKQRERSKVDGRCYSGCEDLVTENRSMQRYEVQSLPSEKDCIITLHNSKPLWVTPYCYCGPLARENLDPYNPPQRRLAF